MAEAHIEQLGRMGFARPAAEAALAQAGGDIHAAINIALATPAEPQGAARPFTPPAVVGAMMEPEPEAGPQERLMQRSQSIITGGGGSGGGMIDRLRMRRDHQEATLGMLRTAGASEEELKVIKADVEVLQRQVAKYEENQAAMAAAREAARQAQEQAQRERAEQQRAAEEARLAREAAAAEAAERVRIAADAAARAEAEAAAQAAAAAAEQQRAAEEEAARARQQQLDEALAAQVENELRANEAAADVEEQAGHALTESLMPGTEWRVEVMDAVETKEGEDGWVFSAKVHITYHIKITRPDRTETVIQKRYSDFDALKAKLAVSEEVKEAEISKLDFATWTWTAGGSLHPDTIEQRKLMFASWLNAVLCLCPGAKDVVEFIDGEGGLLASVNDGGAAQTDPPRVQEPQPEPEPEPQ